jgi:4-aminobutyrate aminotransferase-like enzyme
VAALIAEPIQGVGGFITPPPGYFEILVETVRQAGGLFISDEVQTGFGRTGRLFGWEHWSARPDVMTFAKGLANGAAIGATVADPKVADRFTGASISTFGGNPVSMVAAIATLDVIEGEAIPSRVGRLGKRAFEGLQAMREKHPGTIGDVRGKGLMIGIELVADGKAPAPHKLARMLELTREAGLLIGKGGLYGNVIRLTPPMTVTESELDTGLEILAGCFDRLEGGR